MRGAFFKDNFWSLDITSNIGYDCLLQHMNDGRKNCKEFEDFLKERAAIEERYGKDLLTLTKKKPCGQTEINTLKRALDIFKQQIDNVGQCHIQLAQALRDEARRMEDFREKQKAERKKIEAAMDVMHKQKQMQYKKTMDSKKTYEQKCREKEDAEQNVARCNKNTMNQKQQDKIYAKLAHSKVTLEDADKTYQQNVNLLDKIREDWQSEHIMACVIHEEVRKGLESCNIERDIECFTEGHRTGDKAPAPIPYENFYSNQRNSAPVTRRPPPQTPISIPDDPAYASLDDYRL
ncbi:proline-serine-threonine phosphatase-interacting protein 2 isoform X2 [Rana temporaria]|uniref:proline-serine-threonine phosphatase-interacting protein 2 isoform X2 n=1 Tax=Rana temporaria TaxID=8407 RepID=UPI001AACD6B2|nr:proline-serine-threonine phosphatase-interacting protein 2 isoform X2 [Rana temporaria]